MAGVPNRIVLDPHGPYNVTTSLLPNDAGVRYRGVRTDVDTLRQHSERHVLPQHFIDGGYRVESSFSNFDFQIDVIVNGDYTGVLRPDPRLEEFFSDIVSNNPATGGHVASSSSGPQQALDGAGRDLPPIQQRSGLHDIGSQTEARRGRPPGRVSVEPIAPIRSTRAHRYSLRSIGSDDEGAEQQYQCKRQPGIKLQRPCDHTGCVGLFHAVALIPPGGFQITEALVDSIRRTIDINVRFNGGSRDAAWLRDQLNNVIRSQLGELLIERATMRARGDHGNSNSTYATPGEGYGCNLCGTRFATIGDRDLHIVESQFRSKVVALIKQAWEHLCAFLNNDELIEGAKGVCENLVSSIKQGSCPGNRSATTSATASVVGGSGGFGITQPIPAAGGAIRQAARTKATERKCSGDKRPPSRGTGGDDAPDGDGSDGGDRREGGRGGGDNGGDGGDAGASASGPARRVRRNRFERNELRYAIVYYTGEIAALSGDPDNPRIAIANDLLQFMRGFLQADYFDRILSDHWRELNELFDQMQVHRVNDEFTEREEVILELQQAVTRILTEEELDAEGGSAGGPDDRDREPENGSGDRASPQSDTPSAIRSARDEAKRELQRARDHHQAEIVHAVDRFDTTATDQHNRVLMFIDGLLAARDFDRMFANSDPIRRQFMKIGVSRMARNHDIRQEKLRALQKLVEKYRRGDEYQSSEGSDEDAEMEEEETEDQKATTRAAHVMNGIFSQLLEFRHANQPKVESQLRQLQDCALDLLLNMASNEHYRSDQRLIELVDSLAKANNDGEWLLFLAHLEAFLERGDEIAQQHGTQGRPVPSTSAPTTTTQSTATTTTAATTATAAATSSGAAMVRPTTAQTVLMPGLPTSGFGNSGAPPTVSGPFESQVRLRAIDYNTQHHALVVEPYPNAYGVQLLIQLPRLPHHQLIAQIEVIQRNVIDRTARQIVQVPNVLSHPPLSILPRNPTFGFYATNGIDIYGRTVLLMLTNHLAEAADIQTAILRSIDPYLVDNNTNRATSLTTTITPWLHETPPYIVRPPPQPQPQQQPARPDWPSLRNQAMIEGLRDFHASQRARAAAPASTTAANPANLIAVTVHASIPSAPTSTVAAITSAASSSQALPSAAVAAAVVSGPSTSASGVGIKRGADSSGNGNSTPYKIPKPSTKKDEMNGDGE